MRLFPGKIPIIATEIAKKLSEAGDMEVSNIDEAIADIESVLKEYLRTDKEISDKAKEILEQRNLTYSQFGKTKKLLAEQRGFGTGDETVDYIINQIIGILMHSSNVEEVFADDNELRKKMAPILRKHMAVEEEIENEVKTHMKNLEEGTREWDVEYNKVLSDIKKKHKLV